MKALFCQRLADALRSYFSSDRGNLSTMLALCVLPLFICAGAAVDCSRALNAKVQLESALDSAALYATAYAQNNIGATSDTLTTLSKIYFTQNYEDQADAKVTSFTVTDNGLTVTSVATAQLTTYFMSIAGITTLSVYSTSTVTKSGVNLEVSLVLDNTNSMNSINSKTGNTAIYDLKAAAQKFVSTVMPPTQGTFYTKIAVVPYNNSVNTGSATLAASARGAVVAGTSSTGPGKLNEQFTTSSTYKASYSTSCDNYSGSSSAACQRTFPVTNCVTERVGSQAYTDAAMATYPVGWNYAMVSNGCSATPVVPLSTSATTLNLAIASMLAANSTAGQVGIAWGWYALSPNVGIWSGSSVPATYDKLNTLDASSKVRKVMILMTDGEYNSAYCNGVITGYDTTNGSPGSPYYNSVSGSGSPVDHIGCAPTNGGVYTQSVAMCSAIQKAGIEVFVITFQLDKTYPQRVALVNGCASDAAHVIDADSTSLDAAFASLANKILAMRISS